ncbi:MAG: HTH domain-containing protein, partial [Bacteroidota bacterium]
MSYTNNIARLSRLTAILLKLQTRPSVSVKALAEEFAVSTRTIYRDLEALEQSGVPVMAGEDGGYALVEGYNVPPVMFTEAEANALIIAEKIVAKTKDYSLINDLASAIDKVRSVLRNSEKDKAEFLSERTIIGKNWDNEVTSDLLADIKKALTNFNPIRIGYQRADETVSEREVEPFAAA